jgi:hypothetical protein
MFSKASFTACTYFMNVSDFFLLTEKQLGLIMTAVLAIPMADELPTHNARKTCALAIWLIQVQRLPAEVLQPTASASPMLSDGVSMESLARRARRDQPTMA